MPTNMGAIVMIDGLWGQADTPSSSRRVLKVHKTDKGPIAAAGVFDMVVSSCRSRESCSRRRTSSKDTPCPHRVHALRHPASTERLKDTQPERPCSSDHSKNLADVVGSDECLGVRGV